MRPGGNGPVVVGLVPVHNHEDWCVGAIYSLLVQSLLPQHIVVVDDGSTDASATNIISAFSLTQAPDLVCNNTSCRVWQSKNITLLSTEQAGGPARARNIGLSYYKQREMHVDLFALLDSDDLYLPDKIERSVRAWLKAPDVLAVVYSDYFTMGPDFSHPQYKEPYSANRLYQECIVNSDSLISSASIEAVGGYDESLRVCEDYDLWLRLSERFLMYHLADPLVRIRVGGHSSTASVPRPEWEACYRRVVAKCHERARNR
jgi:glycosyltransferase involved in cell wall biosynthesis